MVLLRINVELIGEGLHLFLLVLVYGEVTLHYQPVLMELQAGLGEAMALVVLSYLVFKQKSTF